MNAHIVSKLFRSCASSRRTAASKRSDGRPSLLLKATPVNAESSPSNSQLTTQIASNAPINDLPEDVIILILEEAILRALGFDKTQTLLGLKDQQKPLLDLMKTSEPTLIESYLRVLNKLFSNYQRVQRSWQGLVRDTEIYKALAPFIATHRCASLHPEFKKVLYFTVPKALRHFSSPVDSKACEAALVWLLLNKNPEELFRYYEPYYRNAPTLPSLLNSIFFIN